MGGKVGQVLSGYFPYPKWLNLIPNSGARARHKSRHKHPRCYFLFLPRAFLPNRPIRHLLRHAFSNMCNLAAVSKLKRYVAMSVDK